MATDLERIEEWEEEARIDAAIREGRIVDCADCGTLTVPYFRDEDDDRERPVCRKCQREVSHE